MDFTGLANIERVEIIRGPAALQHAPAAMGGVLISLCEEVLKFLPFIWNLALEVIIG
jgi:hypothetical protein